jgi:hypothetical protein
MTGVKLDHRKLLWKYMGHVGAMEGITFVSSLRSGSHEDDCTEEELVELRKIEDLGDHYDN